MNKKHFFWSTLAVFFGAVIAFGLFEIVLYTLPNSSKVNNEAGVAYSSPVSQVPAVLGEQVEKKVNNGFLMFRGNPERNLYGVGPLPSDPATIWKYPQKEMCSLSTAEHITKLWCGTGWTGQTVVWEKPDGKTELIFGAYDRAFHFVDADTGKDMMKPFPTGDILKGSATLDPDGFPLYYGGSRDNKLRILALDGENAKELWSIDSGTLGGLWNNDWDGDPVVKDDILYEGCENGWFYAFKLNRHYDANGKVAVDPVMIFKMPSYDSKLLKEIGDNDVSIENSVVFYKERMYFANSGGRIIGLDVSKIAEGVAPVVFDYWVGDDTDATIGIDEEGMLYVSSELERFTERSKELGQFMKLNPYKDDPYVWGIPIPKEQMPKGGIWATSAFYKNYIITTTHTGHLLMVDKANGEVVWKENIAPHAWSSPVVVGDKLLLGTCDGHLRTYSLDNPERPTLDWDYKLSSSCVESVPTVWKGNIYVGTRDGYFYKVGDGEKNVAKVEENLQTR